MTSAKVTNQTANTAKAKIGDDWLSIVDVLLLPANLTLHCAISSHIICSCED